jgi:hypothetical protein
VGLTTDRYQWKHNGQNIGHKKLPQTNLRKDLLEIMKLLLVHLWLLQFWRIIFKELAVLTGFASKYDLEMKVKVKS